MLDAVPDGTLPPHRRVPTGWHSTQGPGGVTVLSAGLASPPSQHHLVDACLDRPAWGSGGMGRWGVPGAWAQPDLGVLEPSVPREEGEVHRKPFCWGLPLAGVDLLNLAGVRMTW